MHDIRARIRRRILPALAAALVAGPLAAQPGIPSLPVDAIEPGMVGEGRTVFSGDEIESFKVTILGVMRNVGPRSSMILAELEGGPLAHTGVIAGMSGSPVYIDGKLIGAVAFAFPFAKDPIAGITPIDEMVQATDTNGVRRASAPLEFPLTSEKLAAVAPTRLGPVAVQGVAMTGVEQLGPHLGRKLTPIMMPASFVGFPAEAVEAIAPLLRPLGLEPLMGGAAAPASGQTEPASLADDPLEPGDSVGVGLVTGDLSISAAGTVTHVDAESGTVYAFGHPLFNLGPISYPMMRSNVHLVLPSVMNSFKMASSYETIGTWVQDRATAIKGTLGPRPRMIPMEVTLETSRGQERKYELELIDDELFSPVLAYSSLIAILQGSERAFGSQTVRLSAWLDTDNGNINVEDVFTRQQPAIAASAMVAAPMSFLMSNDFEDVTIKGIRVEVEATEAPASARIVRAWLDREKLAPGETASLKVLMKTYRGDEVLETVDVPIPASAPSGRLSLIVADASTVSALERREARDSFVPRDMSQLIRAINSLRKNSRVYVRLTRADGSGAIVAGEYLSSLPPSVMGILQSDQSSPSFTKLRNTTLWEHEIATDYDVAGAHSLTLQVEKR